MKRSAILILPLCGPLLALSIMISALDPQATPPVAADALPTVLIVIVDALRPDHVSSYGYERPTTPNLDGRVAAYGTRFVDVTSTSSWTYPANAAMLTGRMPSDIGVEWHKNETRIPESETMLAEYLRDAGYTTAGFVNAFYVESRFGFGDGFDIYETVPMDDNRKPNAAKVNEAALNWLESSRQQGLQDKPLFLYLYYYDPHTPYEAPDPYGLMYDSTYTGTLTGEAYKNGERVISGEIVPDERDIEHLKALYDGEITYWDGQFGEMMDRLTGLGLLDNAIVVVTADHGQMFGEHDKWTHHNSLYEEVVRVPMLISWPGVLTPSAVISAPVTTMDVTPTILDLLGLGVPDGLSGQSLAPLLNGGTADPARAIFSELNGQTYPDGPHYLSSPRYEQRAVKQYGWKFIHEIRNAGGDALYAVQPESLYETENLVADAPEQAEALRTILFDWFTVPTHFTFLPSAHNGEITTLRGSR